MTQQGSSDDPFVLDEDDWFGDGSAFDSGEDLAAALMAFAGPTAAEPTFESAFGPISASDATAQPFVTPEYAAPTFAPMPSADAPHGFGASGTAYVPEFVAADLPGSGRSPSPASAATPAQTWKPRETAASATNAWGIRNSVKILKTTEDVMRRLREDAVEVAWRAAAHTARIVLE